jgi:hypothetical protein
MFEFDALLKRDHGKATATQTPGELTYYQDRIKPIFDCKTIELEVDCNARRDDAIPPGLYKCVRRHSAKYGEHVHITNVPNRDLILIHNANYSRQLLGCVGVGEKHADIDKDGLLDVTNSKNTLEKLMAIVHDEFILKVI